jgi:prevent-host-death family protein
MRKLDVAEDIVPIGEFKTHASKLIRKMHASGRPLVITQNGRPAAVVLGPEDFEELGYRAWVREKIRRGIESAKEKTYSSDEIRERVLARSKKKR